MCVIGESGVLTGVYYRCIQCTYRCVLQVYLQVCVTGVSGVLTGVPGQRVVGGSPAGRSEALGRLPAHPRSAGALGWLDLGAKLRPYHPQQHDGGGLLAPLLVGVGDLLGVGRQVGQTACNATHTSKR